MTAVDLHGIASRFACAADEALYEAADLIGELHKTAKESGVQGPEVDDLGDMSALYGNLLILLNERRLAK